MLYLLLVAFVVSAPLFIAGDEFPEPMCKGEAHFTEYGALGLCRHRKDHSEKTTYHSSIQAEASFFADKDCKGESRDYMVDLGCNRQMREWERHVNLTYAEKVPLGNLMFMFTTDSTCKTNFEGGETYYPKQGECTRTAGRHERVAAMIYKCNSTDVTMEMFFDPHCNSHSHNFYHKVGCNKDPYAEGQYMDLVCH